MELISPQLIVFVSAMLPIAELRVALPLALEVYGMGVVQAWALVLTGNMVPAIAIIYLIGPVSEWLRRRSKLFDRFFIWLFERTRSRFIRNHERWGELALVLFVAIPLPVTGAWTGSLASWLFGIPKHRAVPLILLGLISAAGIVTALTMGVVQGARWLNGV